MLEVLGVKNVNKLVPGDTDQQKPVDPVSENMNVLNGKPVKAFLGQDHESHLAVHMSAMQDPQIQQVMGQNPQAQTLMAAMNAHIAEHLAFAYRQKIEEAAGVPYPAPDQPMDEATEVEVSRLAAAAAKQVLAQSQAKQAQEQAQQAAQDPIVQMQQQELQIKQGELQIKQQKMAIDAAAQKDKLDLEEKRIESQKEIAGLQVGAKAAADKLVADMKAQALQLEEKKFSVESASKADKLDIERERVEAQKEIAGLQVGARIATDKAGLSAKLNQTAPQTTNLQSPKETK